MNTTMTPSTLMKLIASGPWQWRVNEAGKNVSLDGFTRTQLCILDFARWGQASATPRFNSKFLPGDGPCAMDKAFEHAQAIHGQEHNHHFIKHIDHPVAIAIQEAPAMMLALELIAAGLARIEPDTREFCFRRIRYSMSNPCSWSSLMQQIGWDTAVNDLRAHNHAVASHR